MTSLLLLLALQLPAGALKAPEIQYFPSSYFNEQASGDLQARALDRWPGPTRLMELWRNDRLSDHQKIALLLGASAFHDPQILPLYREALLGDNKRLKMAAAWGYRALIGDLAPDLSAQIPDRLYKALAGEIEAVQKTTRRHTLVQLWLASALEAEGRHMPGWTGITFRRSPSTCLGAVARLLKPEDLPDVITAFELTGNISSKISLTRMLEDLTLQRFIFKPRGARAGWGPKVYDDAFVRVENFMAAYCSRGSDRLLRLGFTQLGVLGLDPNEKASCDVWIHILKMPVESWWPIAADHIYSCGGPPSNLNVDLGTSDENKAARGWILKWYGY